MHGLVQSTVRHTYPAPLAKYSQELMGLVIDLEAHVLDKSIGGGVEKARSTAPHPVGTGIRERKSTP